MYLFVPPPFCFRSFLLYDLAAEVCTLVPWTDLKTLKVVEEEEGGKKEEGESFQKLRADLTGEAEAAFDPVAARERKEALLAWLRSRYVDVTEEEEEGQQGVGRLLLAQGSVALSPPYLARDCESASEVALDRVRELLEQFHREEGDKISSDNPQ